MNVWKDAPAATGGGGGWCWRWRSDGDPSRLKLSAVPFAPAHNALLGPLGRILFVGLLFHKHGHLLTDFQPLPRSSATQNFLRGGRKLECLQRSAALLALEVSASPRFCDRAAARFQLCGTLAEQPTLAQHAFVLELLPSGLYVSSASATLARRLQTNYHRCETQTRPVHYCVDAAFVLARL